MKTESLCKYNHYQLINNSVTIRIIESLIIESNGCAGYKNVSRARRKFLRHEEKDVQSMSRTVTTDTSWYGTVVIMGCGFVTMGVQSDYFIVLPEKNPRIVNTVVYIIACYVIYYIILVYGSHKKNKQPKCQYTWKQNVT